MGTLKLTRCSSPKVRGFPGAWNAPLFLGLVFPLLGNTHFSAQKSRRSTRLANGFQQTARAQPVFRPRCLDQTKECKIQRFGQVGQLGQAPVWILLGSVAKTTCLVVLGTRLEPCLGSLAHPQPQGALTCTRVDIVHQLGETL